MVIDEYLRLDFEADSPLPPPEMDPLADEGALQEAQLLSFHFDAVRSTIGLLFELRTALQLRESNTGILVAGRVREFSWAAKEWPPTTPRAAWFISASDAETVDIGLRIQLEGAPGTRVTLVAEAATFWAGDVLNLDEIPDYVSDDDAAIRENLANWQSTFAPVARSTFQVPPHS